MTTENPIVRYDGWVGRRTFDQEKEYWEHTVRNDSVIDSSSLKLLSSPCKDSGLNLGNTCGQKGSLLCNLPVEIRLQIYKNVLGYNCFHIVRQRKRLSHRRCHAPSGTSHYGSSCWGRCTEHSSTPFWYAESEQGIHSASGPFLPFLLSCKLIYSDAISILYRHNVFAIHHCHYILNWFRAIVPVQHLVEIRHLHIEIMTVKHQVAEWHGLSALWRKAVLGGSFHPSPKAVEPVNEFWTAIELMTSLTTLEIRIPHISTCWLFWLAKLHHCSNDDQEEIPDHVAAKYAYIQERPRTCERLKSIRMVLPLAYQVPVKKDDILQIEFQSETQMRSAYFDSEK